MPGRLSQGPCFAGGVLVLADDTGVVRAFEPRKGVGRWEGSIAAAPTQAPQATALGFVFGTASGEVVSFAPQDGHQTSLLPPVAGRPTLAVAWDGGLLVLGGAAPGARRVGADRAASPVGSANPDVAIGAVAGPDGCAWVERGGAVRMLARGAGAAPVDVAGVGTTAHRPALADGMVYAVGPDNVLRAASVKEPGKTAWASPLPGPAAAGPVPWGGVIVVRTAAGLAAYER